MTTTIDCITALFCQVDDHLSCLPKHPEARLWSSEVVTLGLLHALKGVGTRAFYRWLTRDYRPVFPQLPERSRLFRLFTTHQAWTQVFLAAPTVLGGIDTYGIELIHPIREGRSPQPIGRKGLSNHRWIVGGKLCLLLNQYGLVVAWACATANIADTTFQWLIRQCEERMIVLSDTQPFPEGSKSQYSSRSPVCLFVKIYATMRLSSQPSARCTSEGAMAMSAPKARKHLSADALFGLLQTGFALIADHRPGKPDIALTDALMSAFAMFSLKSPSLLAFDQERTEGNVQRVYGIERVPCDTAMRAILDPVEPESLRPLFKDVFRALQRGKALEEMVFVQQFPEGDETQ